MQQGTNRATQIFPFHSLQALHGVWEAMEQQGVVVEEPPALGDEEELLLGEAGGDFTPWDKSRAALRPHLEELLAKLAKVRERRKGVGNAEEGKNWLTRVQVKADEDGGKRLYVPVAACFAASTLEEHRVCFSFRRRCLGFFCSENFKNALAAGFTDAQFLRFFEFFRAGACFGKFLFRHVSDDVLEKVRKSAFLQFLSFFFLRRRSFSKKSVCHFKGFENIFPFLWIFWFLFSAPAQFF